jgi:outer membrane protein assembly factor BamA
VLTSQTGRADDPLSPTRGTIGRLTFEHASGATLSQFRYNRAVVEVSHYRPAPRFATVTLAGRVRAGYVRPIGNTASAGGVGGTSFNLLHPRTRFYAGGAQSVRGYGENQLGPRVLTVDPNVIRGRRDSSGVTSYVPLGGAQPPGDLRECFANRETTLDSTGRRLAYPIGDGSFNPRPLGGSALVEANLEARFPIWQQLFGAVFVDAGVLGERSFRDLTAGTRTVTPGFGVRYRSPVGPVRVDLGIRPNRAEVLPVITQFTDSTGANRLFDLTSGGACTDAAVRPACRQFRRDTQSGVQGVVRRLVLHLSIGEAF